MDHTDVRSKRMTWVCHWFHGAARLASRSAPTTTRQYRTAVQAAPDSMWYNIFALAARVFADAAAPGRLARGWAASSCKAYRPVEPRTGILRRGASMP